MNIVFQRVPVGSPYSRSISVPTAQLITALNLPPGLTISNSGVISGTPNQVGRFTSTILARGVGGTGAAVLDITVKTPTVPIITSSELVTAETLVPFSYQITTDSVLPITFAATSLPTGLSLNTSTGLITGTPSVTGGSAENFQTAQLSATNSLGTGNLNLYFTLQQRPVVTSSLTPLFYDIGSPITPYTITASKSPVSFTATPLSAGLSLDSNTGIISGTPTTPAPVILTSLTATNAALTSSPASLPIGIVVPETVFTYSNGTTSSVNTATINSSSYSPSLTLTGVAFGSSATSISDYAFQNQAGINSLIFSANSSITSIGLYAFEGCSSIAGALNFPNGLTSIGDWAFHNCFSLTSVTIPNSVTTLGDFVFNACTGLTSVTLGNSVTSMSAGLFYNCISLTNVTIPNSVTSIDGYAFGNTNLIGTFTIPNSVTLLDTVSFFGNPGLTTVIIGTGVQTLGSVVFDNMPNLQTMKFLGNAPANSNTGITIAQFGTVYYCANRTGFTNPFCGRPSVGVGPC